MEFLAILYSEDLMIVFEIKKIPDLALNKYQAFAESGIEGMLKAQTVFLRQLHGVLLLYNESMHFIFQYNPELQQGNKLHIFLCFNGDDKANEYIRKIVKSSVLSEYFFIEEIENINNFKYSARAVLRKKERILQTKINNIEQFFYVVPNWKINENARLYNMHRLMQTFNQKCTYMVDIFTTENLEELLHRNFEKPLTFLRNISKNEKGMSELSKIRMSDRDPNADETLKQYEDFLKNVDESSVFRVRVSALSDDKDFCQMLLDSSCSECLESGNGTIETYEDICCVEDMFSKSIDNEELYIKRAPETMKILPTTYLTEELAAFTRLPVLYDGEYIEIPKETFVLQKKDGFDLGRDKNDYEVKIPLEMLPKHMFVCGIPGAGKTNTMLHIANSLWNYESINSNNEKEKAKVPFLVLEPAKKEYRELALMDIPELLIFSPSANTQFPLEINPFEFPIGLTVSEHINNLCQVFEGAFPIAPPAPFILDRAIQAVYEKHNWNVKEVNMGKKDYPTISELYDQFEIEMNKTNYDGEVKGNIRSVLEMRIGSLLRREKKEIFDVKESTLKPEEWLQKPIIIELEALGENLANFVTLLLCTIIREVLKVKPYKNKKPRHVIFIEEAHNLISPKSQVENGEDSNPKIAATAYIVKMLAEVRALREGIIIADQLPSAMAPEVIKNTNIKIVHRLTSGDDRELVGSTMSASPMQMESLATYIPGKALFSYEDLLRPYEIQVNVIDAHSEKNVVSDDREQISNDKFLYDKMLQKPGFMELCRKREVNKFVSLKEKTQEIISMERKVCKSIAEFDMNSSYERFETVWESAANKLKGIHILKEDLKLKSFMIKELFVDKDRIDKLIEIVDVLGNELERILAKLYVDYK